MKYLENPFTPSFGEVPAISLADNRLFGIWTVPS